MKSERFREIAGTRKHQISRDINLEDTWLISKNKYLAWDPTNEGIKTGYTAAAGQCFVGASTRKGMRIITVVLASKDWKNDYKSLNDWAFARHSLATVEPAGAKVGEAKVLGGAKDKVGLRLVDDVRYPQSGDAAPNLKMKVYGIKGLSAPIKEGQRAGSAIFSDGTGWTFTAPLVAAEEVGHGSLVARAAHMHWSSYALAGMLGVGAMVVRKKARRMASGAGRR
jgi:D-alanyl-D-alanine carboxypeptidase (penicillin-binding protein 5/6)